MNFKSRIKTTLFVLGILFAATLTAQIIKIDGMEFPVPSGNPNQLFYLQRTENINTVVYELNEQNGVLNTEDPIHIFWIMYEKDQQHQNLSEMEQKFAYGIKIKSSGNLPCQFTLVACPNITLQLVKDASQKYHVCVTPNKQKMVLQHAYIKVKEGGLNLRPHVEYIEFSGTDAMSGKEMTERVIP